MCKITLYGTKWIHERIGGSGMEFIPKQERRRIFRNELYNLKDQGYITQDQYNEVSEAHNEFFSHQLIREQEEKEGLINKRTEKRTSIQPITASQRTTKENVKPEPVKLKPKKTAEEIRERNISWSLNIGVIMLLIGGLFVATSNWETMTPWMKAASIALVSSLFYGIGSFSYKILKIEKTAFAFVILASLFLPIFTLSLGWFELLGPYLSFNGEGRFILGSISSSVLIPVYTLLAKRLSSRLFVWFTFIAGTASAAYLLKALGLEADGFYLGMMIFNTALIAGYHYCKKNVLIPLFTKELAIYSQANLILSTLLMLLYFENPIYYGFNLILTAVIYLSMIYVNGRKEYHFVFSVMFVYGAYQILDNWTFPEASLIGYALLGFVFLSLPKLLSSQFALKKAFQLTSAVVSGLAFVMISVEGILLHSENPSLTLFAAYVIIAANFIYLSNTNHHNVTFRYLSPLFLASAFCEAVMELDSWLNFDSLTLPIYFIGFILFTVFGWKLEIKYLKSIQTSSRDIGMLIMLLTVFVGFALFQWWELAFILFLNAIMFYLIIKIDNRPLLALLAVWAAPISFGLSTAALGEEIHSFSSFYQDLLGVPGNFALAGILLLVTSFFIRSQDQLSKSAFFSSHGFYAAALLFTFTAPLPDIFGGSLIWFGGIIMSVILYKKTHERMISYLTGVIALAWYSITLDGINEEWIDFSRAEEAFLLPGGAWMLVAAALPLLKKERKLAEGIAWVAHVYMAPVLILSYMTYGELTIWIYLIATGIYAINIYFVKSEWKIKTFLYAAFTTLFLTLKTGIIYFTDEDFGYFAFMASSIMIAAVWRFSGKEFKQRTVYYLVPFSILGIVSFLAVYPYSWTLYGFTLIYSAGVLLLLHHVKWDLFNSLPLLMIFYATIQLIFQERLDVMYEISILAVLGVLLLLAGRTIYPKLWETGGAYGLKSIDAYSIVSFLYIVSILIFQPETFWSQIVHGILMSGALWLQRDRVYGEGKLLLSFFSGAYLLVPYYAVLDEIDLPRFWERETYVLPFVALIIFLRYITKGKWGKLTGYIQWAVLILVSLALIMDGLASNTVYDALILGSLSLIAMLAGMWLRVKSYFFVGVGVLLLNVVLQTRPFWGNLPWWGYLLIAGTILISVASFNEWNKQKGARGEKTFIVKLKERLNSNLKNWN
jgi:hypothetical protein